MYIIDDLKTKMLLKTNILSLKYININVNEEKLLIKNYNNLIINI